MILMASLAQAADEIYLGQSNLDSRKIVIYEHNPKGHDKEIGYIKKSLLDPRKLILYDKNGKPQGYLRKGVLDSNKIELKKK